MCLLFYGENNMDFLANPVHGGWSDLHHTAQFPTGTHQSGPFPPGWILTTTCSQGCSVSRAFPKGIPISCATHPSPSTHSVFMGRYDLGTDMKLKENYMGPRFWLIPMQRVTVVCFQVPRALTPSAWQRLG